jgi:hypothetical protein
MSIFGSEATALARPSDVTWRRVDPRLLLYAAVVFSVAGLFIQTRTAAVAIACQRQADGTMTCDLDRRMLFGTVSLDRERVTGVTRARSVGGMAGRMGRRRQLHTVVLDTADGPREAGWSIDVYASTALAHEINQRIRARAASFEGTLQPHFVERILRLFGLFTTLVGVTLVPLSLLRGRRRPSGEMPSGGSRSEP